MNTSSEQKTPHETRTRTDRLPMWRIGLTGGVVGLLCCVGPTVLALLGIVGAGTAFTWATDLYAGYAWWFRLAGLAATALLGVLTIGVATYVALYALTTRLGTLA